MDIIKELNLNKTPKDVRNGSIVAAKNIMIDDTGSYITNEYGFRVAFECPNEREIIVGVIPCNKESVIFTYNINNRESKVYRLKDTGEQKEVFCNWTYNGGDITGSYTYNYKSELIIAVAESNAKMAGVPVDVPLKTWNLDKDYYNKDYAIEENVTPFDVSYYLSNSGSLLSGVYTFFIRFKINDDTYTKWFVLTGDVIVTNTVTKEAPIHSFLNIEGTAVVSNAAEHFDSFAVNDNGLSIRNVIINLNFDNINFEEYQIGYIFKRDSDVVGRIKNTYNVSTTTVNISNNTYIEEELIDNFLEVPHQFYNVKNVINYNNRLYIANYKEYPNQNLQAYANKVKVKYITKKSEPSTVTVNVETYNLRCNVGPWIENELIENINYYKKGEQTFVVNPYNFIKENIVDKITIPHTPSSSLIPINNTHIWKKNNNLITTNFSLYRGNTANHKMYTPVFSTNYDYSKNYNIIINDNAFYLKDNWGNIFNLNSKDVGFQILIDVNTVNGSDVLHEKYWITNPEDAVPVTFANPDIKGLFVSSFVGTKITKDYENAVEDTYLNNRSLIPNQVYNFFIHYIRPDYSETNGFKISNEKESNFVIERNDKNEVFYKVPNIKDTDKRLIFPTFTVDELPDDYIGWFITYEEVEVTSIPLLYYNAELNKVLTKPEYRFANTTSIFSGTSLYGEYFKKEGVNTKLTPKRTKIKNQLIEPHLELADAEKDADSIYYYINENPSIYNKAVKRLYRLTRNIFKHDLKKEISSYEYIPSYYNNEHIIYYSREVIISPAASHAISKDGNKTLYTIRNNNTPNYSPVPTNAYSIKQDYQQGSVLLTNTGTSSESVGQSFGVFYNKVLSPDNLTNFLELKAAYESKPLKTYSNYSKDYINIFNKTIYRSDVISDESLVNNFKNFQANNYKNILENKGEITNIVGIGLYFIVHTEYSLFVFDRSPKLTIKSQLDIPDVFSLDYQEVLPSNQGFGGLKNKEESIISKNGYIWYDATSKYILKYENGKVEIISKNIHNLLKKLDIQTVKFAEDIISNRLLICIYLDRDNTLTISYNFNTETFISLHDYSFTDNYRTYNISYLFNKYKDRKRLYTFDKASVDFCNLANKNHVIYPAYTPKTKDNGSE